MSKDKLRDAHDVAEWTGSAKLVIFSLILQVNKLQDYCGTLEQQLAALTIIRESTVRYMQTQNEEIADLKNRIPLYTLRSCEHSKKYAASRLCKKCYDRLAQRHRRGMSLDSPKGSHSTHSR